MRHLSTAGTWPLRAQGRAEFPMASPPLLPSGPDLAEAAEGPDRRASRLNSSRPAKPSKQAPSSSGGGVRPIWPHVSHQPRDLGLGEVSCSGQDVQIHLPPEGSRRELPPLPPKAYGSTTKEPVPVVEALDHRRGARRVVVSWRRSGRPPPVRWPGTRSRSPSAPRSGRTPTRAALSRKGSLAHQPPRCPVDAALDKGAASRYPYLYPSMRYLRFTTYMSHAGRTFRAEARMRRLFPLFTWDRPPDDVEHVQRWTAVEALDAAGQQLEQNPGRLAAELAVPQTPDWR